MCVWGGGEGGGERKGEEEINILTLRESAFIRNKPNSSSIHRGYNLRQKKDVEISEID